MSETRLADLARKATRGDGKAMEALLTDLHPRLRQFYAGWLFHHHRDPEVVKDLAQEALLRVAQRLGQCCAEDDDSLVGWCMTLARRIGFDFLRSSRSDWAVRTFARELDRDVSVQVEPGETDRQLFALLEEVHAAQTETVRSVLWLRLVEGLSWHEVGCALTISAGAAKGMFQRAQARMRKDVLQRVEQLPLQSRAALEGRLMSRRPKSRRPALTAATREVYG